MRSKRTRAITTFTTSAVLVAMAGGTLAQMQSTATSDPQRIESGGLSMACDGGTMDLPIRNLSAGDAASRTMTLVNSGSIAYEAGSVTLTPIDRGGTALTTTPEGVSVRVLDGAREVLASTALASWSQPLAIDLGDASLAAGASTNLTLEWALSGAAPNALQGLSDSVTFRCDAVQAESVGGTDAFSLAYAGPTALAPNEDVAATALARGGSGAKRYAITTGPEWFAIDENTGALTARAGVSGTYPLDLAVTDANGRVARTRVLITVSAATILPSAVLATDPAGGRIGAATVAVGTKIYTFGGYNGQDLATTRIYDTVTNTISAGPSLPTTLIDATPTVVGTKVYLLGGLSGSNRNELSRFIIFDTVTGQYTFRYLTMSMRGLHREAAVIDGKIHFVTNTYGSPKSINTLWAYDPATDTTTAVSTPLPYDLISETMSMAILDGNLYLSGEGTSRLGGRPMYRKNANGTWTALATPQQVAGASLVEKGGKLYAVGGNIAGTITTSAAIYVYDAALDSWSLLDAKLAIASVGTYLGGPVVVVDGVAYTAYGDLISAGETRVAAIQRIGF